MDEKRKVEFIPFHAINEFMRNDFRLSVLRTTLAMLPKLDRKFSTPINRLTQKHVKVAGFRNSVKAPASVKAVAMVKAFEKEPKLVASVLDAWAESYADLRQKVYNLLVNRAWVLLPIETDRTRLPGFLTRWPEDDDYEVLYDAFNQAYPESQASIDEVSLMVVWLAGRLPIEKVSKGDLTPQAIPEEESEN